MRESCIITVNFITFISYRTSIGTNLKIHDAYFIKSRIPGFIKQKTNSFGAIVPFTHSDHYLPKKKKRTKNTIGLSLHMLFR